MNVKSDLSPLIRNLVHTGAALTLFPSHESAETPAPVLIAGEHALTARAFTYFIPSESITGTVHCLAFAELRTAQGRGVDFFDDGRRVAHLGPVTEGGVELGAQWQAWQRWVKDHQPHYGETIAGELRSVSRAATGGAI